MADETKEKIVDAAYRTLVRQGYHATSMRDIAAAAGVAPGLAHYYFDSKEDLLVAAIEYGCRPLMTDWEYGITKTGPLPENADVLQIGVLEFQRAKEQLKTYRDLFLLTFDMFGVGLHDPKIASAVKAFIDDRRAFIARITQGVIAGMAEPPVASADAIAAAVWGSLHGIYLQQLMDPEFDGAAAIDALAEMAITFATRPRTETNARINARIAKEA